MREQVSFGGSWSYANWLYKTHPPIPFSHLFLKKLVAFSDGSCSVDEIFAHIKPLRIDRAIKAASNRERIVKKELILTENRPLRRTT